MCVGILHRDKLIEHDREIENKYEKVRKKKREGEGEQAQAREGIRGKERKRGEGF